MREMVKIPLKPDYDLWGKKAYWTFEEATALLLGHDPDRVKWQDIKHYALIGTPEKKFKDLLDLIGRASVTGEFGDSVAQKLANHVPPRIFIDWAMFNDFPIPNLLLEQLEKRKLRQTAKSQLSREEIKKSQTAYKSPYIELMLKAIADNRITTENQSKHESLKSWFLKNAPKELLVTPSKAGYMASLVRLPESSSGGNKKTKKV